MKLLWKIHILQWWSARAVDAEYGVPHYLGLEAWRKWWVRRMKETT